LPDSGESRKNNGQSPAVHTCRTGLENGFYTLAFEHYTEGNKMGNKTG
jgi:hypothetical protein